MIGRVAEGISKNTGLGLKRETLFKKNQLQAFVSPFIISFCMVRKIVRNLCNEKELIRFIMKDVSLKSFK
jgi:hypothetical protein